MSIIPEPFQQVRLPDPRDARIRELDAACKVLAAELSSARQHRANQCSVARAFDSGHDWESAVKLAESKQADNWKAWCAFKSATDANPTAARYLAAAREETR